MAHVKQSVTVLDEEEVLWPDESEFIAYYQHFKGLTKEAAQQKWTTEKANPNTRRRGQGSGLRLAVLGIPKTKGQHAQEQSRILASNFALENLEEAQAALKRMRFGSFNLNLSSQAFS